MSRVRTGARLGVAETILRRPRGADSAGPSRHPSRRSGARGRTSASSAEAQGLDRLGLLGSDNAEFC